MLLLVPRIRRAIGDMRVANHLRIGNTVQLLQPLQQQPQCLKLRQWHRLVMVPDHLNANRILVALLLRIPH